jgi:hypothetical protein
VQLLDQPHLVYFVYCVVQLLQSPEVQRVGSELKSQFLQTGNGLDVEPVFVLEFFVQFQKRCIFNSVIPLVSVAEVFLFGLLGLLFSLQNFLVQLEFCLEH